MLNGNLALVESKLSEARSLLDQDRANADAGTTEVAAHYDEALFGLQVAICYCEAGQSERSLELYDRWLSPETFSRRDYAYFLALRGEAHAIADEPDSAATAGLEAFSLARETESVRTVQEVTRLAVHLEQWSDRERVHDLRKSVLVG
jgi:tetratricopeptide (TPR) repeat protein